MQEYIPYCYLIGWSFLNKWYYGSEYSQKTKIANPNNLFNRDSRYCYTTSSKEVQQLIELHGYPNVVNIRKRFTDSRTCREWEHKVLRRLKVIHSEKWINKTNNKGVSLECITNIPKSDSHREKIQRAARDRDYTGANNPNYGNPNGRSGIPSFFKGKKHTAKTKQKISDSVSGANNGMFGVHRIGKNAPNYGNKHSDASKAKMRKPRKNTTGMQNKMYITDGNINKKVDKDSAIPVGFRKGRC